MVALTAGMTANRDSIATLSWVGSVLIQYSLSTHSVLMVCTHRWHDGEPGQHGDAELGGALEERQHLGAV